MPNNRVKMDSFSVAFFVLKEHKTIHSKTVTYSGRYEYRSEYD